MSKVVALTSEIVVDLPLGMADNSGTRHSWTPSAATSGPMSARMATSFVRASEFLIVGACGLLSGVYAPENGAVAVAIMAIAAMAVAACFVSIVNARQGYAVGALASVATDSPAQAAAFCGSIAFFAVLGVFVFPIEALAAWSVTFALIGGVVMSAWRHAVGYAVRRLIESGALVRRAVVYGGGEISATLIPELAARAGTDVRVCGYFDDRADRAPSVLAGLPRLGGLDDLVGFARKNRVDLIIIALPMNAEERVERLLKTVSVLPADVKLPAVATRIKLVERAYSYLGPVAMIDLADKPIAEWSGVTKRLFDVVVSACALLILSPLMLAIAALVAKDGRGPILFRQKRYGFNNELIEVLKFRSMYCDCADADASRLVSRGDDRVTPIGRFLRKSSLDELPQLFNVLKGELSLVGPRPHALKAKAEQRLYDDVVEGYFARHKVKPGITGWAQINGWRGETDTAEKIEQRVACDLHYIENWSIWFDISILARTPFALIKAENAF